jgi:DNA-binding response OmpR family regulator
MKKSPKILLIEDDVFLANMYNTKFGLEGFEVLEAVDGEKGLRIAKKSRPSLILLDLILPGPFDGFEVLENLKKEKKTKNIPVIVLTNLGEKNHIEKALELGAADYLIKTHFLPSEIVDKVKSLIIE